MVSPTDNGNARPVWFVSGGTEWYQFTLYWQHEDRHDHRDAGSFSFQGLAKPRMAKAWPGAQPMRRIAAAMLVSPPLRSSPKTTLRNAAIT